MPDWAKRGISAAAPAARGGHSGGLTDGRNRSRLRCDARCAWRRYRLVRMRHMLLAFILILVRSAYLVGGTSAGPGIAASVRWPGGRGPRPLPPTLVAMEARNESGVAEPA